MRLEVAFFGGSERCGARAERGVDHPRSGVWDGPGGPLRAWCLAPCGAVFWGGVLGRAGVLLSLWCGAFWPGVRSRGLPRSRRSAPVCRAVCCVLRGGFGAFWVRFWCIAFFRAAWFPYKFNENVRKLRYNFRTLLRFLSGNFRASSYPGGLKYPLKISSV